MGNGINRVQYVGSKDKIGVTMTEVCSECIMNNNNRSRKGNGLPTSVMSGYLKDNNDPIMFSTELSV